MHDSSITVLYFPELCMCYSPIYGEKNLRIYRGIPITREVSLIRRVVRNSTFVLLMCYPPYSA